MRISLFLSICIIVVAIWWFGISTKCKRIRWTCVNMWKLETKDINSIELNKHHTPSEIYMWFAFNYGVIFIHLLKWQLFDMAMDASLIYLRNAIRAYTSIISIDRIHVAFVLFVGLVCMPDFVRAHLSVCFLPVTIIQLSIARQVFNWKFDPNPLYAAQLDSHSLTPSDQKNKTTRFWNHLIWAQTTVMDNRSVFNTQTIFI